MNAYKTLIFITLLTIAAPALAEIHDTRTPISQQNGKIVRVVEMNGYSTTLCLEPNTINYFMSTKDIGKYIVMGANTDVYKQCTDASCMIEKVIGTDQFVVTKDNDGNYTSTPFEYLATVDNNFGGNCTFDDKDRQCIGWAHCVFFQAQTNTTNSQVNKQNPSPKGKWIKLSNKDFSGIDCMPYTADNEAMIDNESVKSLNIIGNNIDSYSQCYDKTCKQSKSLGNDNYVIKNSNDEGSYTSEPLLSTIKVDPSYGQDCSYSKSASKKLMLHRT